MKLVILDLDNKKLVDQSIAHGILTQLGCYIELKEIEPFVQDYAQLVETLSKIFNWQHKENNNAARHT